MIHSFVLRNIVEVCGARVMRWAGRNATCQGNIVVCNGLSYSFGNFVKMSLQVSVTSALRQVWVLLGHLRIVVLVANVAAVTKGYVFNNPVRW